MNNVTHEMWQLFDEHAGVLELRGIRPGLPTRTKIISWQQFPEDMGLEPMFDDFTDTAYDWDKAGYNVYAVFNTIDEDFSGSNVKDQDIEARRFILIDIDRAVKADCPANDAEIQHAIDLSNEIKTFMTAQGWTDPLTVMSGNGIHLYYHVCFLPNTPEITLKIRDLLKLLGEKFDNQHVKVDRSVYNASRITKVIGTTAKKGTKSPNRPYRKVRILSQKGSWGMRLPCFNTLLDKTLRNFGAGKKQTPQPVKKHSLTPQSKALDNTPNNFARVSKLLNKVSSDCERDKWRSIVWAILSTGMEGAEDLALEWSIKSDRYTETDFLNLIRDYDPNVAGKGGNISVGTLIYYAKSAEQAGESQAIGPQ